MLQTRLSLIFCAFVGAANAFVPASPTNDTNAAVQAGLNETDTSKIHIQWYGNGSYWTTVSYALAGAQSKGFTQGALVHFLESGEKTQNDTTQTPWVALISCDQNATNASTTEDVFTVAKEKGAVSAVLYSRYSQACLLSPSYVNASGYNHSIDVFMTQSLNSTKLIEYQFGNSNSNDSSLYRDFNATTLNATRTTVNESIAGTQPIAPGYLIASLQASNASDAPSNSSSSGTPKKSGSKHAPRGDGLPTQLLLSLFTLVVISRAL